MNFYEIMYIVHPILEMGRLYDLIIDIENNLKGKEGNVLYTKVIGKKRMAYPIQNQKFGTYILAQYKSKGLKNSEFRFDLEHNSNILRHMIINITESDIKEQSEDIKDQISGLTKTTSNKNMDKTETKIETESSEELTAKNESIEEKKTDDEPVISNQDMDSENNTDKQEQES